VDAAYRDDDTSLHISLLKSHFEIAKLSINHNADVSVVNKRNVTPLHALFLVAVTKKC